MSKIRLQGPENFGGFSHDGQSYTPDDDGVIEVPAHLPTDVLVSHRLKPAPAKVVKPLAKGGKGGDEAKADDESSSKESVADDSVSDGSDKVSDGEPIRAAKKGAKGGKGGEQ